MSLFARDMSAQPLNHTMVTLLIILLILLIATLALVACLLFLRQRRRAQKQQIRLPLTVQARLSTSSSLRSSHKRVMVRPSEKSSVHIYEEKKYNDSDDSLSSTASSLPEIRITFPDEVDDSTGKRQSGRVVVVHVGDTGVGLEPVSEKLPAYQQHGRGDSFDSIDLEKVGGLVEKARNAPTKW